VGKCIFFGNIENTIFGVASSSISDGISKLKKPKKKKKTNNGGDGLAIDQPMLLHMWVRLQWKQQWHSSSQNLHLDEKGT